MKDGRDSIGDEPALGGTPPERDPSEWTADRGDAPSPEGGCIHGVDGEPALAARLGAGAAEWRALVETRRAACSGASSVALGVALAVIAGPVAIAGVFLATLADPTGPAASVLVAPALEEFMKQAGMIHLVERRPWRILGAGQIALTAALAGLGFAALENLLYLHVYLADLPPDRWAAVAAYRWTACVALHVACALVGSVGVIRAWRARLAGDGSGDMEPAWPWLLAAAAIHAAHNLAVYTLAAAGAGPGD